MTLLDSLGFDVEAIWAICLRDLKRLWRDRTRFLGGVVRPVLWLLIMGHSLKPAVTNLGVDYTKYLFPGVLGMTLVFTALHSAISIIWDREFGFLKEVMVAPIPRSAVMLGKVLSGTVEACLQGLTTLVFAPLIGLWPTLIQVGELLLVMFLVSFSLTALGTAIAARMTSFEGFGTISNFIIMPMYFLSGAIYPVDRLPLWIKSLTVINPLTYCIDAIRAITVGLNVFPLMQDLSLIIVFGLVMLLVAYPAFLR